MVHDVRRELAGYLFAIGRQYHEIGWRSPKAALKLSPVNHMHGHYSVSLAECGRRLYPAEYRHCNATMREAGWGHAVHGVTATDEFHAPSRTAAIANETLGVLGLDLHVTENQILNDAGFVGAG